MKYLLITVALVLAVCLLSCRSYHTRNSCPIDSTFLRRLQKRLKYEVKTLCTVDVRHQLPSDSATVSGQVFDRLTGEPIPALVGIVGKGKNTFCGADGKFRIRVLRELIVLEVKYIGMNTFRTQPVALDGDCTITVCLGASVIK